MPSKDMFWPHPQIVNKHLLKDLIELGLWNEETKATLIAHHGSVQRLPGLPTDIKALYKTAWEISQKVIICNEIVTL
jgi:hypothetical protein